MIIGLLHRRFDGLVFTDDQTFLIHLFRILLILVAWWNGFALVGKGKLLMAFKHDFLLFLVVVGALRDVTAEDERATVL